MKIKWLNTREKTLKTVRWLEIYLVIKQILFECWVCGRHCGAWDKNNSFLFFLKFISTVGWMKNSLSLEGSDGLGETNT